METDTRIDDLIDRWEELHAQGTRLTIEELCSDCPELVAEVRRRIAILRDVDSALDTPVRDPRTISEDQAGGAAAVRRLPEVLHATAVYRPQRHHDHGGLGVVFTAREQELDRTVALKRIRPDRRHAAARGRFLREAALTARLQHPGIVPIYGLGQDDGGPFYTMPFIQGQTLQQAIEALHGDEALRSDPGRRSLRFRGLLQQFLAACNTVAYAHDQGIVHRDLKPSNLMLGPYGETLVLDWGLAKQWGGEESAAEAGGAGPWPSPSPEDVTATGEILGTPQYMSPEQAKGEPAGPAGDIFSLGLILYGILTGKSAFAESRFRGGDPLEAVRAAAIVPPRRRDPRLSRSLEAICLKALAARAQDRYATARALGEDVARWLADEPVSAWREPLWARLRRWVRRHPRLVTGAAAATLVGLVALAGLVVVMTTANRTIRRQSTAIQQQYQALATSSRALAESRAEAVRERDQAKGVTDFLIASFRKPDPAQDGRDVKLADVLDRASAQLEKAFTGSQPTKGGLLNALGETYRGLGLYDRAVSLHERARGMREAALGPDHPDTLSSRTNLANAYRAAGRLPEAIALHEGTLKLREARLGPDHPDTLGTRNNLAVAYYYAGRTSEAIALHEGTLKLREARLGPGHPDTLYSRNNLAVAYAAAGRLSEAIALCEATLKLEEAKLGPDHPDTLGNRANLATYYRAAGRTTEAIALYQVTLQQQKAKLGPDHPATLASRHNLAIAYSEAGRLSEAIALYETTLKLKEAKLGPDHPDTLQCRIGLAGAHESLGRWAEAERLYRDTVARRRRTEKLESPLLAGDLTALGGNLLAQSRWSEAEPLLREALAIRTKATPDDWPRYGTMSLLGAALLGQGRHAEAEPLVVAGYEGMKAREARIEVPDRSHLREAAARIVRLYEEWNKPEQAAAWKAKLGMPDLPAEVFARP
jgi:serine/threonine protein kinase